MRDMLSFQMFRGNIELNRKKDRKRERKRELFGCETLYVSSCKRNVPELDGRARERESKDLRFKIMKSNQPSYRVVYDIRFWLYGYISTYQGDTTHFSVRRLNMSLALQLVNILTLSKTLPLFWMCDALNRYHYFDYLNFRWHLCPFKILQWIQIQDNIIFQCRSLCLLESVQMYVYLFVCACACAIA